MKEDVIAAHEHTSVPHANCCATSEKSRLSLNLDFNRSELWRGADFESGIAWKGVFL